MDEPAVRGAIQIAAEASAVDEWSTLTALSPADLFGSQGRSLLTELVGNWLGEKAGDGDRAAAVEEICDRVRDSLLADAETRAHLRDSGAEGIDDFLGEIVNQVYPFDHAPRVDGRAESGWSRIYTALIKDSEDPLAWRDLDAGVRAIARRHFWRLTAAIEDDLAGETVARVFVSLSQAHGAETFGAFVYGHFRNVKRAVCNRLARNEQRLGELDIQSPSFETPNSRELTVLRGCVDGLEGRARRAIHLAFWQDASSDEIALTLGVTNVNARQILWRAKAQLRKCVKAHLLGSGLDTTSLDRA